MSEDRPVKLTVELTTEEAWQFAQFLKRSTFDIYRHCATSDDEAYAMISAAAHIRVELAEKGYRPR